MKIFIFIAFALSIVVQANFLTAAVRGIEPIILSVGTVLAAIGLDVKPIREVSLFDFLGRSSNMEVKKLHKELKETIKSLQE